MPGPPVQFGPPVTNANVKAGYGFIPNGVEEKNLYFYHPDHLGSSSYITDKNGEIIQHTEYMAFGEVLVDEHSTTNKMPYLFNGKELDYDTGLYYYGARYYDPKTSIFLNVDPLVEKTMSPYAYVNNNPINLIDPTGMEAEECPQCPKKMHNDNDMSQVVTIRGKKYYQNTTNIPAKIGNWLNGLLGGDLDYFVEKKPYDRADNNFIHETVGQSAGAVVAGGVIKVGGVIVKEAGKKVFTSSSSITSSSVAQIGASTTAKNLVFAGDEAVIHFGKHGGSVMQALGKSSYNIKNYLADANYIIQNGTFVPQLNGYVRFIGGQGSAKYGFVGLNRATGNITTFHIKTAKELAKKAPNMFSK